jgi:hypothetical protein
MLVERKNSSSYKSSTEGMFEGITYVEEKKKGIIYM